MANESTKTNPGRNRLGNRYRLTKLLGDSMADVYEAYDEHLKRKVIVKRLKEVDRHNVEARERFIREAKLGSSLAHRYIMQVFELCCEKDELPYIVAEFIPGETLDRVLAQRRFKTLSQKVFAAACIAEALGHAHSRGVVHRDLKPSNCVITKDGVAKLIDLGIARKDGYTITSVGAVVGTPAYMAPEQVQGIAPTPKVDIYAFGVTFYEMLTDRRLVETPDQFAAMHQILNAEPDLRPLRGAGVPPEMVELVEKCLKKSPAERPADFREILRVLRGKARAPRVQKKGINLGPILKTLRYAGMAALVAIGCYYAVEKSALLLPVAPPPTPEQVHVRLVETPVTPQVTRESAQAPQRRRHPSVPEPTLKEFVAPRAAIPAPEAELATPEPISGGPSAMPAGPSAGFTPPPPESAKAVWRRTLRLGGKEGSLRVFQNQLVFESKGQTFTMQVVSLRCAGRRCVAEGVSERSLTLAVDRKTGGLLQEGRVTATGKRAQKKKLQKWEFTWK